MSDLINRADAIEAVVAVGRIVPTMAIRLKYALESLPSASSEDRLYIMIYADDEPSVKAEKLYQICDEEQNREVAEWLKEYFPY